VAKLTKLKEMLDNGLITQADYDAAKNKILGL
jgi:membrane peptidoglycan carboxypeptidase